MDKLTIDAMVERLELLEAGNARMERKLDRWRWAGGLAMLGTVLLVVGGAQRAENPKVVEAERFVVRDKDGKERGFLGVNDKGVSILFLKAPNGFPIASVYSKDDGEGHLALFSPEGRQSITLSAAGKTVNSPSLDMSRDDKRITLAIERNAESIRPWLQLKDGKRSLFQAPEPIAKLIKPDPAD